MPFVSRGLQQDEYAHHATTRISSFKNQSYPSMSHLNTIDQSLLFVDKVIGISQLE